MKKLGIAIIFLFSFTLISCAGTRNPAPVPERTDPIVNNIEEDILVLINKYRKSKRLPGLVMNDVIVKVSRKHSSDMAFAKVAFGHDGFDNRVKAINDKMGKRLSVAENVAAGQRNAAEVVEAWIKSPHHRENIEGNFTETGIGVVADKKGVLYYTQIFVR